MCVINITANYTISRISNDMSSGVIGVNTVGAWKNHFLLIGEGGGGLKVRGRLVTGREGVEGRGRGVQWKATERVRGKLGGE